LQQARGIQDQNGIDSRAQSRAITAPFDSSGWALLTDALLQEGFSEQDIHKIMGENVVRVLLETLP